MQRSVGAAKLARTSLLLHSNHEHKTGVTLGMTSSWSCIGVFIEPLCDCNCSLRATASQCFLDPCSNYCLARGFAPCCAWSSFMIASTAWLIAATDGCRGYISTNSLANCSSKNTGLRYSVQAPARGRSTILVAASCNMMIGCAQPYLAQLDACYEQQWDAQALEGDLRKIKAKRTHRQRHAAMCCMPQRIVMCGV